MSKNKGRIILVLVVLVPVLWVLIWKTGEHKLKPVKIYGDEEMDGSFTPWIIPDFSFIDQNGDSVSLKNFENQVFVANFFYATCPTICPKMQNNVHLVVDKFKNNPAVAFISHTVNPEHDSVEVLKDYANRYGYPADKWEFVTGNKREIYRMAEDYYHVVSTQSDGEADFIHSTIAVLVDKDHRVRGMYETSSPAFYSEITAAIKALIKEYQLKENDKKQ